MNREEASHFAKVLQAYTEGKTIQLYVDGKWEDILVSDFNCSPESYRIKPEPKRTVGYRQYYWYDRDKIVVSLVWENLYEEETCCVEHRKEFIKWKHTEWQYDDVVVE